MRKRMRIPDLPCIGLFVRLCLTELLDQYGLLVRA